MTYKLFIDDERHPPDVWYDGRCEIARSSLHAKLYIEWYGMPSFISFDHDLGGEDTSMIFLSWLEDELIEGRLAFPEDFDYYVHSQNPIGKQNIIGKMEALLKHFKGN